MSAKAKAFLGEWLARYIRPMPYQTHEDNARQLTSVCVNLAEAAGITRHELVEVAGRHLAGFIHKALEERQDEFIKKNAASGHGFGHGCVPQTLQKPCDKCNSG